MANEDPTLRPDDPETPEEQPAPAQADDGEPDTASGDASPEAAIDEAPDGRTATGPDEAPSGAGDSGEGPEGGTPEAEALAEARRERDEYLDHLRRERAEFENFRRRMARERAEALDRGAERLVGNLIGVLDNFGFVLEAAKDSPDESLSKGTQMVYAELLDVLRKAGLEEIPGVGEKFDPTWHEAMLQVEADEPVDEPVVAEVLRPGYRFKDRVLRPASVSVAQ